MSPRRSPWKAVLALWLAAAAGCSTPEPPPGPAGDPRLRHALQLTRQGRFAAAADCLQAAAREGADPAEVSLRLAEAHLGSGRRQAALEQLESLPAEARQRPLYGVLRAWLRAFDGEALQARSETEGILARSPDSVEGRVLLASLALQAAATMDLEAAARWSAEVLEEVPGHRVAEGMLLQAELRLGRFEAAAERGRELAQRHSDGQLWMLAGTAALWADDPQAAIGALRRAVDLSGEAALQRRRALWLLSLAWEAAESPGLPEPRYQFTPYAPAPPPPSVPRFVDVAHTAGVAKVDRGRGSSWLDFDGDGDWDLFSVGIHVPHSLYENVGGRFDDVTGTRGLDDPRGGWGASTADVDDDGDPDLFVTRDAWEGAAPNSLYRNDRASGFVDVAPEAGLAGAEASFTAAWGDFDIDGRLDLYVANGVIADGGANGLHHNRTAPGGAILFTDVAPEAGADDSLKSIGTASGDYDGDGLPDIYCANIGGPNRLYRNQGGMLFEETAAAAGVVFPVEGGYICFFLDFDNDGLLDLFVSTMSAFDDVLHSAVNGRAVEPNRPFLYRNEGDGTFTDVARPAGLGRSFGSMGAGVGDVDNDGFPDLYLANGGPEMFRLEPNVMFLNRGDGTFADISRAAGVANLGKGHGATFADYDEDGDQDLYAGLGGHYDADLWANALYRNDGPAGRSISVRALSGPRDAPGARILVEAGGSRVHAQVASGFGFGSSNAAAVTVGLGTAEAVDRLEVVWPGGQRQSWGTLPAGAQVLVRQGRAEAEIGKAGSGPP